MRRSSRVKKPCIQPTYDDRNLIRSISSVLKKEVSSRSFEEEELISGNEDLVRELSRRKRNNDLSKKRELEHEDSHSELIIKCQQLAHLIQQSKSLVVYTGAGISTAASIPDYRGSNGVWTLLKQGILCKTTDLSLAEPTYTHMALFELFKRGFLRRVVSQNCDGLHLRSGLPQNALSELHGNMYLEVCRPCKKEYLRKFDVTEKTGVRRHKTGRLCHVCKAPLHDTIIHFGEKSPFQSPHNWKQATAAANRADLILCLGSSLKVLKKYSCLWGTKQAEPPKLVVVNLMWTPKDKKAVLKINGKCDEVMSLVMKNLSLEVPQYNRTADPILHLETPLRRNELNTTTKIAIFSSPSFKKLPESHLKVKVLRRNLSKNNFTQLSSSLTDSSSSSSFYDKLDKNDDDFMMGISEVMLKEELDKMRNEKIDDDETIVALTDTCTNTSEKPFLEQTKNNDNIKIKSKSDEICFDASLFNKTIDDTNETFDSPVLIDRTIESNLATVECLDNIDNPPLNNSVQLTYNSPHLNTNAEDTSCDNSHQTIEYTRISNLIKSDNCSNGINGEDKSKLDIDKSCEVNGSFCEESNKTKKFGANESIAQNQAHDLNHDINNTPNNENALEDTTTSRPLYDNNYINPIALNTTASSKDDNIVRDTIEDKNPKGKNVMGNIKNNLSRRQPYRSAKLKHLLLKDQGLLLHRMRLKMSQRPLASSNAHDLNSIKKENIYENNTEFIYENPNKDCFNVKSLYNENETDEIKIRDINQRIGSVNRRENKKTNISNVSINVFDESSSTETMSVKENDEDDYESGTDDDNVLDNFDDNITKNDDHTLIYKKKKGGRPKKIDHTNYESNKIIENNVPKNNDFNERFLSKAIYNRLHNSNHLILDHSYTNKNHISFNQKYLSKNILTYGQDLTALEDSRPGWFGKGMYMRRFKRKRKFF